MSVTAHGAQQPRIVDYMSVRRRSAERTLIVHPGIHVAVRFGVVVRMRIGVVISCTTTGPSHMMMMGMLVHHSHVHIPGALCEAWRGVCRWGRKAPTHITPRSCSGPLLIRMSTAGSILDLMGQDDSIISIWDLVGRRDPSHGVGTPTLLV